MNNFNVKKVVIVLASVALISLGLVLIGGKVQGQKIFKDNNEIVSIKGQGNIDETKEVDAKDIKKINIDTVSSYVNIILTKDNKVKAHFYGSTFDKNKAPKLGAKLSGSNLDITIKHSKQFIFLGNFNLNTKLDIYIPESYKNDIVVETVSGEINIDKFEVNNFNASTTSGDIKIISLTANKTNFDSISGTIDIKSLIAKNSDFETTSGHIKIEVVTGDIKAESVSGNIKIAYKDFNNDVSAETVSGDVELTMPEGSEFKIDFSTIVGDLDNQFSLVIQGKTDKKNIKGIVGNGEKTIEIETTSGDASINKR